MVLFFNGVFVYEGFNASGVPRSSEYTGLNAFAESFVTHALTSGDNLLQDNRRLIDRSLNRTCSAGPESSRVFTFSKFQVPKQDYFVCEKIEYLFSIFRFLLSWRNLSGKFTVF